MKCNNCGGTMRYDVGRQGLVCDFCGALKPLDKPEAQNVSVERSFDASLSQASTDWGIIRRQVTCKQCGAALLYDADQISGMCPYCGSAIVLDAAETNSCIAPTGIIPFTTTREEVEKNYYKWNKFAIWSPESFRKGKVLGNLVGVYVPFWTFDTDTVSSYAGDFGTTVTRGDSQVTEYRKGSGVVNAFIDDVCISASKRFVSNKKMSSVVRFKPDEIMPYTPEALAGFSAEKYTIDINEAWGLAQDTFKKRIESAACKKEYAECCKNVQMSTNFSNVKFRYFLFPVWLAACPYKGKIYYVVASGHDNRGLCDRPVSAAKLILLVLAILSMLAIPFVAYVVMMLISIFGQM